jgi:hypothetical protein
MFLNMGEARLPMNGDSLRGLRLGVKPVRFRVILPLFVAKTPRSDTVSFNFLTP